MSLAIPPMPVAGGGERASVVLPTVKCSSCTVAIPLNELGEHVCNSNPMPPLPRSHLNPARAPPIITKDASPPLLQLPFTSPGIHRTNAPNTLQTPDANGFLIGEVVGPSPSRFGDYPADVPLSAVSETSMGRWPIGDAPPGHVLPSPTLPDTTSGGFAGMAGVGRRAFAAAAWSVRAGVALAAGGAAHHHEGSNSGSFNSSPERREPTITMPVPVATASPPSRDRTLERASPPRSSPPLDRSNSGTKGSPTPREPVILPKVPLSGRQRSNTIRDGANRSASRQEEFRAPSRAQVDQRSASSMSHRDRERLNEPNPFFERYNQTLGSKSDQTHMGASTRWQKDDDEGSLGSLDDDSQLPWVMSPEQTDVQRFDHQRNLTNGSIESGSSSASCGPGELRSAGGSGHEELVMTPNQSWEGLAERNGNGSIMESMKKPFDNPGLGLGDALAQIGEEDEDEEEGERFVMGAPQAARSGSNSNKSSPNLGRSQSDLTASPSNKLSQRTLEPARVPQQFRPHEMEPPRLGLMMSTGSSPASNNSPARKRRTCASCGDSVGGSRRFVERDGVVLCEADWKKLYLPSCRRCKNPIEKSAVSSSDGQLKGKWHRACFTCTRCDRPFEGDDFYVHDGRPWCQYHYAEENGTLCAANACGKPIEGPCILAPGTNGCQDLRFHPGHLRCDHRGGASGSQNCRESMNEYYEVGGERFCERHGAEAVRRLAASGGRAEKRRTRLVDLSPIAGGLAGLGGGLGSVREGAGRL